MGDAKGSLYEEYQAARSDKSGTARVAPSATEALAPPTMKPMRRTGKAPMLEMDKLVHEASDLLSHQAIMQNFVHHNPWEFFQHMDWDEALHEIEEKAAYMSPAERLSQLAPLDPRTRANKAVAELSGPYLDRGLAKWEAPEREKGFLHFFAKAEGLGLSPWRSHARDAAKEIIDAFGRDPNLDAKELAYSIIGRNLAVMEDKPEYWEDTSRSMMMDLIGFAGMFKRMEEHPAEGPTTCKDGECVMIPVNLAEFAAVQSIMMLSSVEAMARKLGWDPSSKTLSGFLSKVARKRKSDRPIFGMGKDMDNLRSPSGLSYTNQAYDQKDDLEEVYAAVTLKGFNMFKQPEQGSIAAPADRPNLQFMTCFDEREESYRRYIEAEAYGPGDIVTYGVAGFFNMAIRYNSASQMPQEILAPEGNVPPLGHVLDEYYVDPKFPEKRQLQAEVSLAYEKATFSPLGSLAIAGALLPYSMGKLLLRSFAPQTTMELEDTLNEALGTPKYAVTDFEPVYTAEEATARLAQLFKNIGVMTNWARLVVATGHGARSVNNPFIAAYNCGACCGREGGPNARVMARCANDPEVRALLASEHGIVIPDDTWFVGGYHDTTSDLVELYDLDRVPESHAADLARASNVLDRARANNALERSAKFFLFDGNTPEAALKHAEVRSRDVAEVRPELGHSTNAAVVVGRRSLTQGKFFDRRVFMPHYDPFNDDDEGTNLQTVITPALVVGSGISLEYFFSCVDGGAGTKVPVNVVGNFGIQQGTAGDLLIGLATQMSEMHSPQRALYLIDAPVERVEKCLARNKWLLDCVRNNWVKFYVRDPYTQTIYFQQNGEYTPVDTNELPSLFVGNARVDHVPFDGPDDSHAMHAQRVKFSEDVYAAIAFAVAAGSALLPAYRAGFDLAAIDPHQAAVTAGATALGLSNLAYSRRYLHGEYMFGRMAGCSASMVLGFNLVASAPSLAEALLGWSIIGFSSTFLIGGFNDRPTARDNAAYAFGIYQVSDAALLTAAAFSGQGVATEHPQVAAAGLLVAALLKSSQWPVNGLFLRSMEGASPNSALGYAGISAHAGVVLLASTMPLWFDYEWARLTLGSVGLLTIIQSTIVANVRADRKGGIASAASATVGAILCILAAGYSDAALLLALGHASFRMNQVVRSPGIIQEMTKWEAALGRDKLQPNKVFAFVWQLGWAMNRFNSDFLRLPDTFAGVDLKRPLVFYNALFAQVIATVTVLALCGGMHLPAVDDSIMDIMREHPGGAAAILAGNAVVSTAFIRFLLGNVLDFNRFGPNA